MAVLSQDITSIQVKQVGAGNKSQDSLPLSEIVRRIIILESSAGRNNFSRCESIGKYNRSGYGIHGGKWICFDTKEEEEKAIGKWFENKMQSMTLEQALKVYNSINPNYLSNFLNL